MNNDQFIRYKALDRCLRTNPACFDMEGLLSACSSAIQAFHADPTRSVSRRTIEQDLTDLKLRYDIRLCEDKRLGRKKLYQYEDTSFSLMNKLLADGTLEQMLLQNVLDTLTLYDDVPQYKWLKIFLQQQMKGENGKTRLIIEFQNNLDLSGLEHLDELIDAILNRHPLALTYQKYFHEPQEIVVHPYLLKQYNDRWFLIAGIEGYDTVSTFAIDRILDVKPQDTPYIPSGIDFTEYFDDVVGVSRKPSNPTEDVRIRISKKRYPYIETKPLHSSQKRIHDLCDEDHEVINLHVQINNELEASILSLGNDAEVLSPPSLREKIKEKVRNLSKMYND